VRRVTLLVRDALDEQGLRGWPKTSGSRGMHVNVRIQRRWSFEQVRRAALVLAREVERRAPDLASYPGAAAGCIPRSSHPAVSAFPGRGRRVGLHIDLFEMLWGGRRGNWHHRRRIEPMECPPCRSRMT
jgi:hypothetical protein